MKPNITLDQMNKYEQMKTNMKTNMITLNHMNK